MYKKPFQYCAERVFVLSTNGSEFVKNCNLTDLLTVYRIIFYEQLRFNTFDL